MRRASIQTKATGGAPNSAARTGAAVRQPEVYALLLEPAALHHYARQLKLKSSAEALGALARAIAFSSDWAETPGAVLVYRPSPSPAIGVLGCFDPVGAARVKTQLPYLNGECARLRYVSYSRAERDCRHLAERLVRRFGTETLRRFCFTSIPRGGHIVLGMLAYALGLEQTQLSARPEPDVPLVVVDDCALSGCRFGRFLERCESRQVIFATLYSHPALQAAIEAREPRVVACLSARDLHAPDAGLADEPRPFRRENYLANLTRPRYWFGDVETVCFAWKEPTHVVWNSASRTFEGGWQIVPPEVCLGNRGGSGEPTIPVQAQPEGGGPLAPSEHVLFGSFEGMTVIADLATGRSFGLEGVAADIWLAVVKHGRLDDVARSLMNKYEVGRANLRSDLCSFIDKLIGHGLLRHR